MVVIEPDENLLAAIRSLSNNKVHRLLVIDRETGNALHVLTLKRILRYLLSHVRNPQSELFFGIFVDDVYVSFTWFK